MAKEETEKVEEKIISYEEDGRICIHSPLPKHPGVIVVDKFCGPATIIEVMQRADTLPDIYKGDHVPFSFREFYVRFPLFDFSGLKDFKPITQEQLESGKGFPAILAVYCVKGTAGFFGDIFDLKN